MKLNSVLLYYITDRHQFSGGDSQQRTQLLENMADAQRCGIDFIQLREKDLSPRELEGLGRKAVSILHAQSGSHARLLINSRVDVAVAIGAGGVHLRSGNDELSPSEARTIFHKAGITNPVIGVSCHTSADVSLAEAHGADFVVFGPVFAEGSPAQTDSAGRAKKGIEEAGLEALRVVCAPEAGTSGRLPVLALGGVTLANAVSCREAGAAGVAAIRLFQPHAAGELQMRIAQLRKIASSAQMKTKLHHPYQS